MATWTYNTSPFDDIARVRLLIGDTDIVPTTDAQFSDEELQEFITQAGGDLYLAASAALGAWIGALSRELESEKIGDYSYKRTSIANMKKLKDQYEAKVASTPYFTWGEMDLAAVGETPVVEE